MSRYKLAVATGWLVLRVHNDEIVALTFLLLHT
jgi:very-short-patch-repair endonuclease